MHLHLALAPRMPSARTTAERPPSPVLPGLWARLVERGLEPLSASWDARSSGLRLELLVTEAAAPAAKEEARHIAEAAVRDHDGQITVHVEARNPALAFE